MNTVGAPVVGRDAEVREGLVRARGHQGRFVGVGDPRKKITDPVVEREGGVAEGIGIVGRGGAGGEARLGEGPC